MKCRPPTAPAALTAIQFRHLLRLSRMLTADALQRHLAGCPGLAARLRRLTHLALSAMDSEGVDPTADLGVPDLDELGHLAWLIKLDELAGLSTRTLSEAGAWRLR